MIGIRSGKRKRRVRSGITRRVRCVFGVRCRGDLVLKQVWVSWQLLIVVVHDVETCPMGHCLFEDYVADLEDAVTRRVVNAIPSASHIAHHLPFPALLPQLPLALVEIFHPRIASPHPQVRNIQLHEVAMLILPSEPSDPRNDIGMTRGRDETRT
jgi:hypothetical protein